LEALRKAGAVTSTRPSTERKRAKRAVLDLRASLPKILRIWRCAKPVEEKHAPETDEAAEMPGSKFVAEAEASLTALQAALDRAMPFIDFPPAAVSRHRRKAKHVLMFHIAVAAANALHCAGRRTLSIEPEGPLVDFIVQALEGMGRAAPQHATIATILRRTPAMNWVKRQLLMAPPQTKNRS
jgi:hypothetical protein